MKQTLSEIVALRNKVENLVSDSYKNGTIDAVAGEKLEEAFMALDEAGQAQRRYLVSMGVEP